MDLPCVGRNRELALVVEGFASASEGKGSAWVVAGPAGIGKSRFLLRAEELGRQRGFEIRVGHAIEGTLLPLGPFREMLRPSPRPESVLRPGHLRKAAGASTSIDLRILELIEDLESSSRERPQLVLLDDAQFADAESLRCLDLLIRRARTHPIVVVTAVRTGPSTHTSTDSRFGEIRRSGRVHWIDLPPLDEEARYLLLAPLLGRTVEGLRASEPVRQLVRLAGGSPYFLIELANSWPPADRVFGPVDSTPGSGSTGGVDPARTGLNPPSNVQEAVLARLANLLPQDRNLLGLAARVGFGFDAESLAGGLGAPVAKVDAELARLSRDGWPVRAVGGGRFAFEHDLLRQAVLAASECSPSKQQLSRLLAWWAAHRTDEPLTEARLRTMTGDGTGAVACLERAIDEAFVRRVFRSVPELLRWGVLELGGPGGIDAHLLSLYLKTGERLRNLWEPDALRDVVRDLSASLGGHDLPFRAAAWNVELLDERSIEEAGRRLTELEGRVAASSPREQNEARPTLDYLRAVHAWYALPPPVTHRRIARALRRLRGPEHGTSRFRLHAYEIFLLSNERRFEEAHREVRRASRLMARGELGPSRLRSVMLQARCHLAFREGRALSALAEVRASLRSARHLGDVGLEARPLLQLALFEYALRRTKSARAHLDEAERLFARLDAGPRLAACRLLRGWTWALDEEWTEAERSFRGALEICQTVDLPTVRWAGTFGLALVRAETGDPSGALANLPPVLPTSLRTQAYLNEYRCSTARIRELNGDAAGAFEALQLAASEAHRTNAPRTDLVEVLGQLVRWERTHGTARRARVWRDRLARVRLDPKVDFAHGWKLLGGGPSTPPRPRVPGALSPGDPAPNSGAMRGFPERILRLLATLPGDRPSLSNETRRTGATEEEIATALGEGRSRFVRALGRLRTEGLIDRDTVKLSDRARRRFAYRLTHRGSEVAAALGSRFS